MKNEKGLINRVRLLSEFINLTSIDSESFNERFIADYLIKKLKDLGLRVEVDDADIKLLSIANGSAHTASNIYAFHKGNGDLPAVLFSAHMDTVKPGKGKKAVIHKDGRITSEGNTVLGADDVSGLVSILEALTVIKENRLRTGDIEVLFTVAEEPYCSGSRYLQYEKIKAKTGYVFDLTGRVGTAAVAAPSILSIGIKVIGKAAHSGFAPEQGINALSITADALSHIKTGRIDKDLTVNFGTIIGGSGKNIVPETIEIEGEIRCMEHKKAMDEANLIKEEFEKTASIYGGRIEMTVLEQIHSYRISEEKDVVKKFLRAVSEAGRCIEPECIDTFGGSDANRLNEHGIETIVVACAMECSHGTAEYTTVEELEKAAELALNLMTV